MWNHPIFQSLMTRLESLDLHQVTVLVIGIVAFGVFCLRGYGSRSNY